MRKSESERTDSCNMQRWFSHMCTGHLYEYSYRILTGSTAMVGGSWFMHRVAQFEGFGNVMAPGKKLEIFVTITMNQII